MSNEIKKSPEGLVYKKKLKSYEKRDLWLGRLFIWVMMAIVLFPIIYVVNSSLSSGDSFFSGKLIPTSLTLDNYKDVLENTDFLIWMKNSLIVCITVSTLQVIMSLTAAYAFSRMRFKGRKNGLMTLLILQMFPNMMAIPAILGVAYKFDLMDQLWALIILLAGGSAYSIWLLKGFIDGIPKELDEAAMVDGATHWQIFCKVIIPLTKPMLAVMFIFSFMGVYSEFVLTSALIKDSSNFTLAVGLRSFIQNEFSAHWTQFSAASVMASIPVVVLFMLFQKHVSKGLVAGAVKG